jgi:hypothetical protein
MQDVYIEREESGEITIVTDVPPVRGEELLLELPGLRGRRSVMRVRAMQSSLVPFGDALRSRVTLQLAVPRVSADPEARSSAGNGQHVRKVGILVRRLLVQVVDVSSNGCLIETSEGLEAGTVGMLQLVVDDGSHGEALRICRAVRITGSDVQWRAGAEFLPLKAPTPTSVRNMVARLELMLELDSTAHTRTNSDDAEIAPEQPPASSALDIDEGLLATDEGPVI